MPFLSNTLKLLFALKVPSAFIWTNPPSDPPQEPPILHIPLSVYTHPWFWSLSLPILNPGAAKLFQSTLTKFGGGGTTGFGRGSTAEKSFIFT